MVAQAGITPLSDDTIIKKYSDKTIADLSLLVTAFEQTNSRDTLVPCDILRSLDADISSDFSRQGLDMLPQASAFVALYENNSQIPVSVLDAYLGNFKAQSKIAVPKAYGHLLSALQTLAGKSDKPQPFDITVDPEDDAAMSKVKALITKYAKIRFTCEDERINGTHGRFPLSSVDFYAQKRDPYINGVAFRPMKAWTIRLRSLNPDEDGILPVDTHQVVIFPDEFHILVIAYDRMPFVTKTTNVGFTNGMLTEYSETVPSPILGALGIPKAILQALLPIPSSPTKSSSAGPVAK